jgi:hypothetical protein
MMKLHIPEQAIIGGCLTLLYWEAAIFFVIGVIAWATVGRKYLKKTHDNVHKGEPAKEAPKA